MNLLTHLIIVSLLLSSGCAATKKASTQGIQGVIYQVAGNQMPGIINSKAYPANADNKSSRTPGLKTTLYVYEITNINQVVQQKDSPFYNQVKSNLIMEVESETDGSFKVNLPVGKYSLFVKIGTLYYANRFDEHNNIFPVEVIAGTFSTVDFKVDYDAVY